MSDFFEYSQQVRREIEDSTDLMDKLRGHFALPHAYGYNHQTPLIHMGEGRTNNVYRVGRTNSGLWVAMREREEILGQRESIEMFCRGINRFRERGRDTINSCIGIYSKGEEDDGWDDRYTLLVPDFTENGTKEPRFLGRGDHEEESVETDNKRIIYDVDENLPPKFREQDFKFMAKDAMIHISP
jgi:hypothetical protein